MNILTKILIVDDEPDICQDMGDFLKMKGYSVITANSGKQALRLLVLEKPDLVLMDIRMPEMDGIECLCYLKDINPDVPVIMVTCVTDVDTAKKTINLGASDYITKPINLDHLEETILTYLFLRSGK